MGDSKTGVALAALLTMSGVTMSTEKKLVPEREPKPKPRRKLRPTPAEKELLGKLSEQERKAQETYKRRTAESKAAHKARGREEFAYAASAVREGKAVFDSEAKRLDKERAKAMRTAEVDYSLGIDLLRDNTSQGRREAEEVLNDATQASARQHETETMAFTDELNTALRGIFAERESIEYGDKAKGKGS